MEKSIMDCLCDKKMWEEFVYYKAQCGNLNAREMNHLVEFVRNEKYRDLMAQEMPIAEKRYVAKQGSDRKRVVYTFGEEFNYLLKLMTFLLLRRYDHIFAPNLYSFRANHGVKVAMKGLKADTNLSNRYMFKLDIHDYFNSVDIDLLIPQLQDVLADDLATFQFIEKILREPRVRQADGEVIAEKKGIMAGVPLSAFLANLYLSRMDWDFQNRGIRYLRYSDDIILFTDSAEERDKYADELMAYLQQMHLEVNPKKILAADPHEKWTFLGMSYCDGTFDVSDVSIDKVIAKFRRKYKALLRWQRRKHANSEKVASCFVREVNKKLYSDAENEGQCDLTWSRWYFPMINTTDALHRIDAYVQQCVRYIITGKRTSAQFSCDYDQIKALGYRSLVHEYYKGIK